MAVMDSRGSDPVTATDRPPTQMESVLAGLEDAVLRMPAYGIRRARASQPPAPYRVAMHSLEVDARTQRQVLDRIFASLEWGIGGTMVTPNLEILRLAAKDKEIRDLIREADLIVADGMPLVWASRLARSTVPERVAGSDLIRPLCAIAARAGRSVYLLGGSPGTADAAADLLTREFPGLQVAGTDCPPLGFEHNAAEMQRIRHRVYDAKPDIVLVALGAPKQERLMAELRQILPGAWLLGIGMALGFIAGEQERAPAFLQRHGLEWSHRLIKEPRRLGRRYLRDGIPFAGRLGVWAVRRRFDRSGRWQLEHDPTLIG